MRPKDVARTSEIRQQIIEFSRSRRKLPGIETDAEVDCLVRQMIDSLRRVEFAFYIRDGQHDSCRANPSSAAFDPLRAAVLANRRGNFDEAHWLIFLATHFGKHSIDGWQLTRDIYGRLESGVLWDWRTVTANPQAFIHWLSDYNEILKGADGVSRRFSNHRKYEGLSPLSKSGTGNVVLTYINWIQKYGSHAAVVRDIQQNFGQNPKDVFDQLYQSMNCVARFGRLAKFDYLTMLGKLGISPIDPPRTYIGEATGPRRGAKLLFFGDPNARVSTNNLDDCISEIDSVLNVGMQVLEDSLCNWQKDPKNYFYFRG